MNAEPTLRSLKLKTAFAVAALLYAALSLAVLATASTTRRSLGPADATSLDTSPLAR